jgi:Uma2 family endonuclease
MTTALLPPPAQAADPTRRVIGPTDNGRLMSPEEFDALERSDEEWQLELINGVLIVNAAAGPQETDPNGELELFLRLYMREHPGVIDKTVYECYIRVPNGRRRADRVVWIGLGRLPNLAPDTPAIAVEFVSAGTRNRQRDYEVKRAEYATAGVREYWIFDRFQRTLTVCRGEEILTFAAEATYTTPLLPDFQLPIAAILKCADDWSVPESPK